MKKNGINMKKFRKDMNKLQYFLIRAVRKSLADIATEMVYYPSVLEYTPNSYEKKLGLKKWGYRLSAEMYLEVDIHKPHVKIGNDAPQAAMLHEISPPTFTTPLHATGSPGVRKFLQKPIEMSAPYWGKALADEIGQYLNGRKIGNTENLRGIPK